MQALRHASRQAQRASAAMRESHIASARACSTESVTRTVVRLSKEERHERASQFVEKFKAANNGQLPTITVLRKEVGGSYDILKEFMQGFEQGSSNKVASEKTVDLKKSKTQKPAVTKQDQQDVEGTSQKTMTVAKDGHKKRSLPKEKIVNLEGAATMQDQFEREEATKAPSMQDKHDEVTKASAESVKDGQQKQSLVKKEDEEDPEQDKMPTPEALKSTEEMKSVKRTDTKLTLGHFERQKPSSVQSEDTLESLLDSLSTDEDNDDDSDVAAPEYKHSSMMQKEDVLPQTRGSNLKIGSVVSSKDASQTMKSGLHRKDDNEIEAMQKGLGAVKNVIQSMAKQPFPDSSSGLGSRPPTTVLRIVNLPLHISPPQLRSLCESVAKVHDVNLRRGRIADVHFDVELRDMTNVLDRLRKVVVGNTSLKVFPALRFSCESSMSNRFKPRDVHQFRHVRNGLMYAFEQRFKFLCFQIEDFRELHNLKVSK